VEREYVNLHCHTLVLDAVFSEGPGGTLAFHPAPAPTDAEVAEALAMIRHRVQRQLVRRGLDPHSSGERRWRVLRRGRLDMKSPWADRSD
jgi:hypothetical protein